MPVYASHQYCFCITMKTFRVLRGALGFLYLLVPVCWQCVQTKHVGSKTSNGKTLIAKSYFEIQENQLAVDLTINALQSIWNLDWNSLHASVCQCAPSSDLSLTFFFFSVSCLPQIPLFSSHYLIPVLWWVNDTTIPSVLVVRKRLFYNELWLTIFCALALCDCACGMDHESVINELLL